jgi:hypothetical protein
MTIDLSGEMCYNVYSKGKEGTKKMTKNEILERLNEVKAAIDKGDATPENINEMCRLAFELGKLG